MTFLYKSKLIISHLYRHSEIHNTLSSRHRRDNNMAALLSGIVIVFLICHSTKIITHSYEAYQVLKYAYKGLYYLFSIEHF